MYKHSIRFIIKFSELSHLSPFWTAKLKKIESILLLGQFLVYNIMTSATFLPSLKKSLPLSSSINRSNYLQINSAIRSSRNTSLERQAIDAVSNKRYLYIDFQTTNSFIELQKNNEKEIDEEDEVEKVGDSYIGGLKQLQNLCQPSFRMHKFLSEEKSHLEKRKRLNRIRGLQPFRQSVIDFNRVKQKVNPELLEQYLENKDLEQRWRKIIEKQESLGEMQAEEKPSASRVNNFLKRLQSKSKRKLANRFKLKAVDNLNNLLQN